MTFAQKLVELDISLTEGIRSLAESNFKTQSQFADPKYFLDKKKGIYYLCNGSQIFWSISSKCLIVRTNKSLVHERWKKNQDKVKSLELMIQES